MSLFPSVCPSIRPSDAHHISGTVHHIIIYNTWYTCVKWGYLQFFKIFWKFWFFWLLGGKRAKKPKMENSNYICHAPCQEQYTIWSWFLVLLCKLMTSPDFFLHFFQIYIFWAVKGVKWQKIAQNEK